MIPLGSINRAAHQKETQPATRKHARLVLDPLTQVSCHFHHQKVTP